MDYPTTEQVVSNDALLVSMRRAGELLGVSRPSVYNLIAKGQLAEVRIGDRRMIVRSSIEDLVASAYQSMSNPEK